MNQTNVRSGDMIRQLRKVAFQFSAALLVFAFATVNNAQSSISRQQFARMDVLTRAAYFEKEILKAANEEGVDPNILWTIAYNETRFRPWLTSPKNAQGMMQFIPATAARFGLADPYKAVPSIKAAARYVRYLSNLFGGRVDSILAAYNAGEGTISAYLAGRPLRTGRKIINPKGIKTIGGVPPYTETVHYVGQGLKIYRWLVKRQTYSLSIAKANFPPLISSTVARVQVVDRELGSLPDFNNFAPLLQTKPENAENLVTVPPETPEIDKQPDPKDTKFREVFYESRSGNRFVLNNGKKVKLPDAGVVVISSATRPGTNNQSRSTFFGVSSKK